MTPRGVGCYGGELEHIISITTCHFYALQLMRFILWRRFGEDTTTFFQSDGHSDGMF